MTPPSRAADTRLKVLCVDDEENVLAGLTLNLRRRYDVKTALSGAAGLEALGADHDIAVVISDMRMPGMDGAAFLSKSRALRPDAVRMLLTGHADTTSAAQAVNEGQIFRFLTKPCPAPSLIAAVDAAAQQHRLLTAERVLLEQTLHGSIKAVIDVMALANPIAFGRAIRIKQLVSEMALRLDVDAHWQVEVAAMLAHIGCISLPPDTLERLYYGRSLSEAEQAMVAHVPAVTESLLSSIPRLEQIRAIIARTDKPFRVLAGALDDSRATVERHANMITAAADFDTLTAQGHPASHALDVMRGRSERYDPSILVALAAIHDNASGGADVRDVSLTGLQVGMIFAEDVTMATGALLVTRGYQVTAGFVERARNFRGMVREPLRVMSASLEREQSA